MIFYDITGFEMGGFLQIISMYLCFDVSGIYLACSKSLTLNDFEINEKRKELNYGQFFICFKSR